MGSDEVPRYRELSVTALLVEFKDDLEMMSDLPDVEEMGKQMPRDFLIKVLFKLRPKLHEDRRQPRHLEASRGCRL